MIEKAINICRAIIGEKSSVTDNEINNAIEQCLSMPLFSSTDKNQLHIELLRLYNVRQEEYKMLFDSERNTPWLLDFKANHQKGDWKFWNRYTTYLQNTKNFAPKVIEEIDRLTDDILDKLYDPTTRDVKGIDKKGLVVGQVQSGKTANYTGLICKAADAGFNMIIVLAGLHNNLRSQTQHRLDEDFLGFDTKHDRAWRQDENNRIGVGVLDRNNTAISITTIDSDFKKSLTDSAGGISFDVSNPILLVIKKNSTVLKRLNTWLLSQAEEISGEKKITNKSLLIIDDEADNASINTKKTGETPTAINNWIRKTIGHFYRFGYVGYTATPFANIFIPLDKDDLFPRDFIINIPAPSNYIGPDKIFGTSLEADETNDDLLPVVHKIDKAEYEMYFQDSHKKNSKIPDSLPESLKTAIKCFIIVCAIRIARGQENKHNSMLIHISRYLIWQNSLKELIENMFLFYKRGIEQEDSGIFEQFRIVFEVDADNYTSYCTTTQKILNSSFRDIDSKMKVHNWEEIKPCLYKAVQKIKIMSINGQSADALEYYENEKTGISIIAIGGDKLSRGLTLEGLSVSYFLRASKMYDTLMQMGRWFGYRHGYVDLCRLFTSSELNEWFRHITMASEELREEFDAMWIAKATPEKYALKVRTHPGQLQITAITKMRNVDKILVSWSGRLVETYQLLKNKDVISKNLAETQKFLSKLGNPIVKSSDYLWSNVLSADVLNFFSRFTVAPQLIKVNLATIRKFIDALNKVGELGSWSVALMGKAMATKKFSLSNHVVAGCFTRNTADDTDTYVIRKNHILGNSTDEFIDLDSSVLDEALEESKQGDKNWEKDYPKPKLVREKYRNANNPLLIIYPLDPQGANPKDRDGNPIPEKIIFKENDDVIIGFAIVFPKSNMEHTEEFAINIDLAKEYYQSETDFDDNNDNLEDDE
ncbi:MAG: Z1 domain-containing protein [Bacteroidetes bacterium]|nr:Z1 domain-containing protein [Bacteroidota bacterium]